MAETYIRVFLLAGGHYEAERETYTPDDLGGVIPGVGDLIIDPGVPIGEDRLQPKNRRLFEIKRRYFLPASGSGVVRIALVAEVRSGQPSETDLLGG